MKFIFPQKESDRELLTIESVKPHVKISDFNSKTEKVVNNQSGIILLTHNKAHDVSSLQNKHYKDET